MATDKLFTVVGVSKHNGEYKVRFANDAMRVKVLTKHNHEDIRLVELDEAVSKYEAVQAIQFHADFADSAAQAAIAEYLEEKAPKTPKTKAAPKAKAPTKAKAPKATKAKEDDNTPFAVAEAAVGEALV